MAGMVREERLGGLQERLYFARLLWRYFQAASKQPPGEQLALRSACLLHLYAVPVGLLRILAQRAGLADAASMATITPLLALLQTAGVRVAAVTLIAAALSNTEDSLSWLDAEICANWGAPILARRTPPTDGLTIQHDVTDMPLSERDTSRIEALFTRIETLLSDCQEQIEEW